MRTTVIICCLLAAAVAGCGSSSSNNDGQAANNYALAVQQAQYRFANTFDKATTRLLKSTSPGKDAAALRTAARAVETDATDLQLIHPPAAVRSLHQKLVRAMDGYAKTLRRAARLVGGGDPRAFVRAKSLLTRSSRQISQTFNSVINQINTALL